MNSPDAPNAGGTSTRPYLIRALHDWCTDNGFTPYLAVFVDASVRVPLEYVKNNEIVLNVGFEATSGLQLGNELIEFKGRFGGISRDIVVPVDHVVAIYARENGQGMAFPVPSEVPAGMDSVSPEGGDGEARNDKAAVRGLRLASSESMPATGPDSESAEGQDGERPDPPETPPPGTQGRPSLKRVK